MNSWTTAMIENVNDVVNGWIAGAGSLISGGIGWVVQLLLAFAILAIVVYGIYRFVNR